MDAKSVVWSKTMWLNLAALAAALITASLKVDWVAANPALAAHLAAALAAINLVLRWFTVQPVALSARPVGGEDPDDAAMRIYRGGRS